MDAVAATGDVDRREVYHRAIAPAVERVRHGLIARYGVEVGTDVAAEVARWAWEHLDRLRSVDNIAGYLFRVGQSAARRHRRWRRTTVRFPDGGPWVATNVPDLDDEVIEALKRLSANQRVAVLLVHGYGFTYREVADLLRISEAALTNHVHRAITNLRRHLEDTE